MRNDLDEMGLHVGALDEGGDIPVHSFFSGKTDIFEISAEMNDYGRKIPGIITPDAGDRLERKRALATPPADYPKPETPIVQWLKQQKAKGKYVLIDNVLEQLDG